MPSLSQVKQYLTLTLLPLVAGVAAKWLLTNVKWFGELGVSQKDVAGVITQIGTVAIVAGLAWLAGHHILKGTYAPAPVTSAVPPVAPHLAVVPSQSTVSIVSDPAAPAA